MAHIFISYAKKDTRDLALRLRAALTAIPGMTAWMDASLETGESWAEQIQEEIDKADLVVVLLSPDVNRKGLRSFVLNEIDFAQQEHKPIIPVMAQPTRVPVQLAGIQYISLTGDPDTALRDLVSSIARRAGVRPPRKPAAVNAASSESVRQRPSLRPAVTAIAGLALVGLVVAVLLLNNPSPASTVTPTTAAAIVSSPTQQAAASETPLPDMNALVGQTLTREAEQTLTALPTAASTATIDFQASLDAVAAATRAALQTADAVRIAQATPTPTLSTEQSAFAPDTRNAAWTPVERDFDGVTMVLVPKGCFIMGSDADAQSGDASQWITGVPDGGEQCFDTPFWIDKFEVSQAQFARFGGQQALAPGFAGEQQPVERITWIEARDFCVLRGARLPSEREWEYAARGPDGLSYPWGDEWDASKAIWYGNSGGETAEVGSIPAGASWVGALDMSGNVWEWVGSQLLDYPYNASDGREDIRTDALFVLRGGSWSDTVIDLLRAATRTGWYHPDGWLHHLGFRCARSS
ncbi:MAG: SUMF1/EgtB/PvdO family nonheme iron enzyme [Anaerolineae bacterium]|nr:SUMF1/EgtB/PvdO family nonheme iron enzyme [Anaerolineae bacterium]